jgi:hypothetical protein
MEAINYENKCFVLFITQELGVGLLGQSSDDDEPDFNSYRKQNILKIISYMPLERLDQSIVSLIRLDK